MSATQRKVASNRVDNDSPIEAPIPRSFQRPLILDQDAHPEDEDEEPSSSSEFFGPHYPGDSLTEYRRGQDKLLCQPVHGRTITDLKASPPLPKGRSNRRKRELINKTTNAPPVKMMSKTLNPPLITTKRDAKTKNGICQKPLATSKASAPVRTQIKRPSGPPKSSVNIHSAQVVPVPKERTKLDSAAGVQRTLPVLREPITTMNPALSGAPQAQPRNGNKLKSPPNEFVAQSPVTGHKRKSSFLDPNLSRPSKKKRVKWGEADVKIFEPPPSDVTSDDSTSPSATSWWSDEDSEEEEGDGALQKTLRGGYHPAEGYDERTAFNRYEQGGDIPIIDPQLMVHQTLRLEEGMEINWDMDLDPRMFQGSLNQQLDLDLPKQNSSPTGTDDSLNSVPPIIQEYISRTGDQEIATSDQDILLSSSQSTSVDTSYSRQEEQPTLGMSNMSIVSNKPREPEAVIIPPPESRTPPPHPQADPTIWNLNRPQRSDRVWPPHKGTIYCETCFRDDCLRWTQIRDNMMTVLCLLGGGDFTLHDIREALTSESIKTVLLHHDPTDIIGYVVLHTMAEQQLNTLEMPTKNEVTRVLEKLGQDIGVSLKTLNKLEKQCKKLLLASGGEGKTTDEGNNRTLAKELKHKLGSDIPSDGYMQKIGEEVARSKWGLKQGDRDHVGGDAGTVVFPCAYCSESGAANSSMSRRLSNNTEKPWLKALVWAHESHKIDEDLGAQLEVQDFLNMVASARHSLTAEVPGVLFLVDETGGKTRIVLAEMTSVFDVMWARV